MLLVSVQEQGSQRFKESNFSSFNRSKLMFDQSRYESIELENQPISPLDN